MLGSQEKIPTLDELLECVAGRVPLVIEMKPAPRHEPALAHAAVERLRKYAGPAAVMSFDRSSLQRRARSTWISRSA